jgi:hypothetical protein
LILLNLKFSFVFLKETIFLKIFFVLNDLSGLLCSTVTPVSSFRDNFIKVLNAANNFVGPNKSIQKINEFHINETDLSCIDKQLPIIIVMKYQQNMDEDEALMVPQEKDQCSFFRRFSTFLNLRKYYNIQFNLGILSINFVVVFENKPDVLTES